MGLLRPSRSRPRTTSRRGIRCVEGPGEGAGAVAQMAGEDVRKTRPSPLHAGSRNPGSTKGKGAQDMAHREQKRNRNAGGGFGGWRRRRVKLA